LRKPVIFCRPDDIESVEIVRSSSALVKGLSGLTGVVDVKTKKPEKETVSLLAKYGDLNQYVSHLQYETKSTTSPLPLPLRYSGLMDLPEKREGTDCQFSWKF
jgi:hypothetical protein